MSKGPLEGVRVVELCAYFTGPIAACILADQGADVIKVEPPGGELMRRAGTTRGGQSSMFMAVNRNKRSITLDLKRASHRAALIAVLATADVLIQNMKPGAMHRLGLGSEALRSRFPKLIYASISGYGQTGPNAKEGAFDNMLQAVGGLGFIQRDRVTQRPRLAGTQVADKIAGPIVAQAICAALFKRERTGVGCVIEYAMLDGLIWWLWPDAMMNHTFIGGGSQNAIPISDVDLICQTDDGYLVAAPHKTGDWEKFIALVGRPELHDDPRLRSAPDRTLYFDVYTAAVRESFLGKTTEEWCRLLRECDIPCAPVLTLEQIPHYPQVVWNRVIEEVEHPDAGRHYSPRSAVWFDGKANGTMTHSPTAGADTRAVLREVGVDLDID